MSHEAAVYVHSQIPAYPSVRPGSDYRRTGTLGRTIVSKAEKTGQYTYAGIVGSNLAYAPWVVSEEKGRNQAGPQAWFHQGRWMTWQEVLRRAKSRVVNIYREGIQRLLRL